MPDLVANRYQVVRQLGTGGMGIVSLARDSWRGEREVALKTAAAREPGARASLEREFEALSRLEHPNVVRAHDFGSHDAGDVAYYTMDRALGDSLDVVAARAPREVLAGLLVQLCRAIDYVHARGLVHRDVKAQNVLVSETPRGPVATLVDFGLSRPVAQEADERGTFSGTLTHAAPELLDGGASSPAADLYALGVTAYRCLAGVYPFQHDDALELTEAHRKEPPRPLKERAPDVPAAVASVVDRLLSKHPRDRPASALEFAEVLAASHPGLEAEETASLLAHVRAPRLVEREEARTAVAELVEGVLDQRREGRRGLLVSSRSGLGKTSLLEEARRLAQLRRCRVLHSMGDESSEPLGPLVEPVRQAVRDLGLESAAVRRRLPELVKVDPDLAERTGVSPSPPLPVLDERIRLARAIWELLRDHAVRPVLLVFDDLVDPSPELTWVLAYLARNLDLAARRGRGVPLGLLVGLRAGDSVDRSLERTFGRHGAVLELEPLSRPGTGELVAAMLPGLEDADALADRLHEGVGGNPGMVEQWCAGLVREGSLRRHARGWSWNPGAPGLARPPADLLVAARATVGDLDGAVATTLRGASLLPGPVDSGVLARLLGRSPARVDDDLDELERLGLVRAPARREGRRASPASALVRRAVVPAPPDDDSVALAGSMLDAAHDGSLLRPEERAELAEVAGRRQEAAAAWTEATHSARAGRSAARVAWLARRLASASEGPSRREALRWEAQALCDLDRLEEAATVAARAGRDAAASERPAQELLEARIACSTGRLADAVSHARQGVELLAEDHPERWGSELLLARLLTSVGDPDAEGRVERVLASARDDVSAAQALRVAGALALHAERPDEAAEHLERAVALFGDAEEWLDERANCESNVGVVAMHQGEHARAERHFQRAVELRERAGARSAQALAAVNLAVLEIERERPSSAIKHARAALEVNEEIGSRHGEGLCHVNLAVAALLRDDVLAVRDHCARALELAEETGDSRIGVAAHTAGLVTDALVGWTLRSEDRASAARALLDVADQPTGRHELALAEALVALASGESVEGVERLRRLLAADDLEARDRADALLHLASAATGGEAVWCEPFGDLPEPEVTLESEEAALLLAEARRQATGADSRSQVVHAHLALAVVAARRSVGERGQGFRRVKRRLAVAEDAGGRQVAQRHLRVQLQAAEAWLAARTGRLADAEDGYVRALEQVRRWARRIPADERDAFLGDPRRAGLRRALVAVRRRIASKAEDGSYFAVLEPRRSAPAGGGPSSDGARRAIAEAARLREVIEISRRLNTLMPVADLLESTLESAMKFIHAERAFIVLSGGDELEFAASRDRSGQAVPQAAFAVSRSVLAEVVSTGQPVLTSDARADARFVSKESVLHLDLHSVLVAPLVARDEVIGALYVDNARTAGVFGEDDRDLLMLFAAQAAVAVDNARLHETRIDKERLDQELSLARSIQQGLLPRRPPAEGGFRMAASMEPARDIGGDYYDVIPLPNGDWRVAIGDVAGKGVPAALFMVMARTILRSVAAGDEPLDLALSRANDILEAQIEDDKFMTMLLLEPEANGASLRACIAGHEPPIVHRRATGEIEVLPASGLALGMLPDIGGRLEEAVIRTAPGDVVTCYSDGVTEARAPDGSMFGRERLLDTIRRAAKGGAEATLRAIEADVAAFRGAAERSDDMTLVVLEALGGDP